MNINDKSLTNTFNNHFINICKKIIESIQKDKIACNKPTLNK